MGVWEGNSKVEKWEKTHHPLCMLASALHALVSALRARLSGFARYLRGTSLVLHSSRGRESKTGKHPGPCRAVLSMAVLRYDVSVEAKETGDEMVHRPLQVVPRSAIHNLVFARRAKLFA